MTWTTVTEFVTNLIPYSEDLSQWTELGSVIDSENYYESPFGDRSATLVTDTSDADFGQLFYNVVANSNNSHVLSAFILKDEDETRVPSLRITFNGTKRVAARINTKTGEHYVVADTEITETNSGVDDYGDYWRLWVTGKRETGQINSVVLFPATTTSISAAADASVTGSAVFFGIQLETGTNPTGYIKTEGEAFNKRKVGEWVSPVDKTPSWVTVLTDFYVETGYVLAEYVENDIQVWFKQARQA